MVFPVLRKYQWLEELTLPALSTLRTGWYPAPRCATFPIQGRQRKPELRNDAYIYAAAIMFGVFNSLRLLRFMPEDEDVWYGFDDYYLSHESPYVQSVETARDLRGEFVSFDWRPNLTPLDPTYTSPPRTYQKNLPETTWEKLFLVIKMAALLSEKRL
jgi:hypothetical protein